MSETTPYFPTIEAVEAAAKKLEGVAYYAFDANCSIHQNTIVILVLRREDLQVVRSYKIRGAYNKMSSLTEEEAANGVVCASAGNHAQGVALSCKLLKIQGTIFMPTTPLSKKLSGLKCLGNILSKSYLMVTVLMMLTMPLSKIVQNDRKRLYIPFNDEKVIEGQATLGLRIDQPNRAPIDYIFVAVGGGGLASGMSTVFKLLSPNTKIIGVEPEGAPSMKSAFQKGEVVELDRIDNFVDGAAVKRVGDKNFAICKSNST